MKKDKWILLSIIVLVLLLIDILCMFFCMGVIYHRQKIINVLFLLSSVALSIYNLVKLIKIKEKQRWIYGVLLWFLIFSTLIVGISNTRYNVYPKIAKEKESYIFKEDRNKTLKVIEYKKNHSSYLLYERKLFLGFQIGIQIESNKENKYDLEKIHEKIKKQKGIGLCNC